MATTLHTNVEWEKHRCPRCRARTIALLSIQTLNSASLLQQICPQTACLISAGKCRLWTASASMM